MRQNWQRSCQFWLRSGNLHAREASKQLLCMLASAQLLLSFAEQEQEQAEHAQAPEQNRRFC